MLNKTAKKIWKEMTNQDEKLNEEIWLAESKESDWHICNGHPWITTTIIDKMLDKARQQGKEIGKKENVCKEHGYENTFCVECVVEKHKRIDKSYEQGKEDERKRIIEMIENKVNTTELHEKAPLCWLKLQQVLEQLKNSEAKK